MRYGRLLLVVALAAALLVPARPAVAGGCGGAGPVRFRVLSGDGAVLYGPGQAVPDRRLHLFTRYMTRDVKVRFTFKKVTYTVHPGVFFEVICWAQSGTGNYPAVYVLRGKVDGKSTDESPKHAIVTNEALSHGPAGQPNAYTVSRKPRYADDPDQGTTTLRVRSGRDMTLSPKVGTEVPADCTAGQTMTIDWRGNITRG